MKPGHTVLVKCKKLPTNGAGSRPSSPADCKFAGKTGGGSTEDLSGNLHLWVTYTDESLADEPIVAQSSVCDVIKNHPRFLPDKDNPSSSGHVFRAWTNTPLDSSYVTDTQGHLVIKTRMQSSRLMIQFLCLTDEIRKHAYWDLNINGFINGECVKQKIPIQVMKELRKPPINRKRKKPDYYTFPEHLLAPHEIVAAASESKVSKISENEPKTFPFNAQKLVLPVPPAHTPMDPQTKLHLALQEAMNAVYDEGENEAENLSSSSSTDSNESGENKRRLQLTILNCLEHQKVQRKMKIYENAPIDVIKFKIKELQDYLTN